MRLSKHLIVLALSCASWFASAAPASKAKPVDVRAAATACGIAASAPSSETADFINRSGTTPLQVAGAATVSSKEAKCLMDRLGGRLLVVQSMTGENGLPGAHSLPEAGSPSSSASVQEEVASALRRLTANDLERPLLFYCHGDYCALSFNASVRAAKAGFRHVFWLREGLKGWVAANLPLKGDVPDPSGFTQKYIEHVKSCDSEAAAFDTPAVLRMERDSDSGAAADRAFKRRLEEVQRSRTECLVKGRSLAVTKQSAMDLDSRLAATDREVEQHFKSVRSVLENDPHGVLGASFKNAEEALDGMRATVKAAQDILSVHSVSSACGTLPSHHPSSESERLQLFEAYKSYGVCLRGVAEKFAKAEAQDLEAESDVFRFGMLALGVRFAALADRYSCFRRSGPNCVPDERVRRLSAVANASNLALVQRAAKHQKNLKPQFEAAFKAMEEWTARLNRYVIERNAEIDAENERYERQQRSYSAPSYSVPQPPTPTYRRDSSTSAPGMR